MTVIVQRRPLQQELVLMNIIQRFFPKTRPSFVEEEKKAGRKVIMIGDGINDSPALSAADIGIAISDGAEIAREIADITVGADGLNELVTLKLISDSLMKRIHKNYQILVTDLIPGLIVLGVEYYAAGDICLIT